MFTEWLSRFQPYMEADEGMTGGGEPSEEMEEVADLPEDDGSEETEEVAELPDKSDAAFAQMRREKAELERLLEEERGKSRRYDETLGLFFEGDDKVAQAIAHYEDITVDEAKKRLREEAESTNLKKENETLEGRLQEANLRLAKIDDLEAIRKAIPDAKINSIDELGEEFMAYRVMGISPVDAYNGIMLKKNTPPKPMGKPKTEKPVKDFYTREEVKAMTQREISENYEKVRASMSRWQKG